MIKWIVLLTVYLKQKLFLDSSNVQYFIIPYITLRKLLTNNLFLMRILDYSCISWRRVMLLLMRNKYRSEMAPHSSTLAWRIPRMEEHGMAKSWTQLSDLLTHSLRENDRVQI